jgi:hypothetical protein
MKRFFPALLALFATPVALAQEPVTPATPTAPEDQAVHHAPPPPEEALPAAVPAAGSGSEAHFAALLSFRQRHLDLRGFARWEGGDAVVLHSGWGWGWGGPWWHGGFGTSYVIPTARERVDDWAVFRGTTRLTIPAYLDAVGDEGGSRALQGSIARAERSSRALYAVGGAGLAATVIGFFGAASARDIDTFHAWNVVSTAGLVAGISGVVVGRGQSGRAQRLGHDFSGTLDVQETQTRIDAYNEQLRLDLGLSQGDVYPVLSEEPARRRR